MGAVFFIMRLHCIVVIVFFQDVWGQWGGGIRGGFGAWDALEALEPLEPLEPLEALTDNSGFWLDMLSNNGETWNIYCCDSGGYAVAETCGNGVDCCDVCSWYGGRPTDCVAFLFGNNERQRAEQHCRQAHSDPNYCYAAFVGQVKMLKKAVTFFL